MGVPLKWSVWKIQDRKGTAVYLWFWTFLIKNSITNSIVLEESVEKYYLTLSEVDKVSEGQLHKSLEKYDFDEDNYKYDGFFISLVISKRGRYIPGSY